MSHQEDAKVVLDMLERMGYSAEDVLDLPIGDAVELVLLDQHLRRLDG